MKSRTKTPAVAPPQPTGKSPIESGTRGESAAPGDFETYPRDPTFRDLRRRNERRARLAARVRAQRER
jgi:hypothetical protein